MCHVYCPTHKVQKTAHVARSIFMPFYPQNRFGLDPRNRTRKGLVANAIYRNVPLSILSERRKFSQILLLQSGFSGRGFFVWTSRQIHHLHAGLAVDSRRRKGTARVQRPADQPQPQHRDGLLPESSKKPTIYFSTHTVSPKTLYTMSLDVMFVVFGDQSSVNMQEMALMQEGVKLIFVFSVTFR